MNAAAHKVNLWTPGAGRERHRVPPLGVVAVAVASGDKLEIVDPEGLQRAHVLGLDAAGHGNTAALGFTENTVGVEIANCFRAKDATAWPHRERLRARGVEISAVAAAPAAEILQGETVPGNSVAITCQTDALCLICAPGSDLIIGARESVLPPTELLVFITRAPGGPAAAYVELLPPLADAREEFRIDARTAAAYEIKSGEYIQVIDVAGQQCSDFQCFDSRKLARGVERCLDATTTRALSGADYPKPGLAAKFYDVDFDPVVEVVQDTCGRHDSFGLACNEKYYADAGYPGHVNCSDNFNAALSPYEIAPRRGWMAMNLFFNTFFDGAYQFTFDEPWSRPGDYVLLRALKDLVCVSSACPCDIDAANGWNPTDIHIRIYSPQSPFKRAIAFRKTPNSAPQMTIETGFHSRTKKLTRNFTEYNGYWLPNDFANRGAIAEYWACRERVVIADLSALRKAEVTGPDAELLLQTCVTRDLRKLSVGQVVYTAMCNASGGMIDDGTVFRLGEHNFRWVGGCDTGIAHLREQASARGMQVWVKDSTMQLHNLQVQGPRSVEVLQKIIWTPPPQANVAELGWFRFSVARIGDAQGAPIIISRTGYTGERGYEIFCHPNDAEPVWDAICEAGQEFDVAPMGLQALDILRIEAGLIFAGHEFCEETDPFEAGIGFTVPLKTKQDDFIGRAALLKRKQSPRRKLVGLELVGEEPAANGDGVYRGRMKIGVVTSGVRSPILRKNIALARIDIAHSAPGGNYEVGKLDGHIKRIPCQVVAFPHFDPRKERVRGIVGENFALNH